MSIVTVYQLVLVMMLLPFAGLGERIGLKRIYQLGQLVFTIATVLCFFAKSLPFLLIVRAAQALGAAAALSVSSALVRSIYPPSHLGRGLGINSVVVSSSAALAPTLGGLVLAVAPWPWVFASAVPFAIVSLALGRSLPDPVRRAEPFDVLGAVLCAAMFGLVIGGLESAVHGDSPMGLRRGGCGGGVHRRAVRQARARRGQSDPPGRSARAARARAVDGGRVHRLHRDDDAIAVAALPAPAQLWLRAVRGRHGDRALAADDDVRRAARGLAVGSLSGRAARRDRHDDRGGGG